MQNQNENTTSQISKENHEQSEQIIPFCELPVGDYYMFNVQPSKTKYGQISYFAEFNKIKDYKDDKDYEYYKAWIPNSLLKKFQKLEVEGCWMVSKGKKPFSNNNNKTYWDTKLMKME